MDNSYYKDQIAQAVQDAIMGQGNSIRIEHIANDLDQMDKAMKLLRSKGYGATARLSLLELVNMVPLAEGFVKK